MEIAKARKLNDKDLQKEIDTVSQKIVQLKSEVSMHKIKNHQALKSARRYLARLLTVQNEKKLVGADDSSK